jgi:hypothetical protein
MTRVTHVVGIDPGLVHTGCVRLLFKPGTHVVQLDHAVINGTDVDRIVDWVHMLGLPRPEVFVEDYRPRHNLAPDQAMVNAVGRLRRELLGAKVLSNTGVKRVIPATLMQVLGVYDWPQSTHHQDLRSAARIALLGMMKDPHLNGVLSAAVKDHLAGQTWKVERL